MEGVVSFLSFFALSISFLCILDSPCPLFSGGGGGGVPCCVCMV